ncbi:MAG: signal peptidase II [Terriglobales bacterium]
MKRSALWEYVAAGLAAFVADQWTKTLIDRTPSDFSHTVVPGLFRLVHAENPGVAFGLFQYSSPTFRDLLISLSSLALVVVLALLWRSNHSRRTGYAMALIVAGACGNLMDRVLHGRVVDFLLVYVGHYSWPVFNLADSAICVGAALLVWDILRQQPSRQAAALNSAAAAADTPVRSESGGGSADSASTH